MSKVNYVSLSDLVKLTTKTIEEPERVGIVTILQQCQEACEQPLTPEEIETWCAKLIGFRALSDTISSVRAQLADTKSLKVFCGTLLQYVRQQGEVMSASIRSTPRPAETPASNASGESYARTAAAAEERLAWDLIRQS